MNAEQRTGADLVCDALEAAGVRVLFGHPGGAILPLYDALEGRAALHHVLVRHEQAAAHAADGYARATGRVGVCVATSGPGATNLVTGLATAAMDSVPLVAITGQVPTGVLGSDAFQETDILGITIAVTKHGFQIDDPSEIPAVLADAFRVARSGRPGPVIVDLPKDVQAARVTWSGPPRLDAPVPARSAGAATSPAEPGAPETAAQLLNAARRPVLLVGRGVVVSETSPLVRGLAERYRLPVVTTLLGLDAFPRSHPLCLGMPGMHGSPRANRTLQEADAIVGLGVRFDDRVTGPVKGFAPRARIALFEVDPAAVGRTVEPEVAVVGDLRETLPRFAAAVRVRAPDPWWDRLEEWPREYGPPDPEGPPDPVAASRPPGGREAARSIARAIEASKGQVATDVGQHQMWLAQELRDAAPGTHLTSGGLGTMGYALPAALGAALGRPDRSTWVVAGDGGFQMTMQELATVVQEALPLRIVVLNNGYLGMVRQWQELFFEGRYAASRLDGPDLALLARAYGIPALTVGRSVDLEPAVAWAAASPGPVLLDVRIRQEENVYPIVPPGESLDGLVEEPRPRVAVAGVGAGRRTEAG